MGTLSRLVAAFEEGFFPGRRLRRELRQAPSLSLSDAREGVIARFTGIVRPLGATLIEAPLSGRLCVYYAAKVCQMQGAPEHKLETELGKERDGVDFMLEDSGVRAVIDPRRRARVDAAFDCEWTASGAHDATPAQRALLHRLKLVNTSWVYEPRLIFREAVLEVDEWITMLGAGTLEPDTEAATTGLYRDGPPLRMRFQGSRRFPLTISDDPRTL